METLSFGGVALEDANIIHDSSRALFRSPLGAVPLGSEVSLGLKINGVWIERAVLCVLVGDGQTQRAALCDDGDGMFSVRYAVPGAGAGPVVLWYWFEVALQGGAVCYYGAQPPFPSGLGSIYRNPPPAFQLTVYDEGFATPDWARNAVLYQIFPDRFRMGDADGVRAGVAWHQGMGRGEMELHENWDEQPIFEAKDGRRYYMPSDVFGGDLEGIRQRLGYLQSLGVTALYLNPVFEAASNHRYNTGDYLKIDPILGDEEGFRRLCSEARGLGIRVILDGVFSHTGDDSVYFDRYGRYGGAGAYQGGGSRYFEWYRFLEFPNKYASWWGFESRPEVEEGCADWQSFVISGDGSVVKRWLGAGASGWRLDVADELPDETIELIRTAVKEADADAFLIGEVWENATAKESYGRPRRYALGRGLDSVMNYPFLNRTVEFLMGKTDARMYRRFLVNQRHSYPAPMYYALMNLLSSHDVSRIRSVLGRDFDPHGMARAEQARFALTAEEYVLAGRRQRLAAAIQYSLPGIPSIYYGDEVGMTGLLDPFNRGTWREEDAGMADWYRELARIRGAHRVLAGGHVRFFSTDGNVLGIFRHTVNGRDFFGEEIGSDAVLTVVNPTDAPHRIVFDFREIYGELPLEPFSAAIWRGAQACVSLLTDRMAPLAGGLVEIGMGPLEAEIFRFV